MFIILLLSIYFFGYLTSFLMLRTEISSEGDSYTFGDRLLIFSLSILSWLWVLVILVTSWVKMIKQSGYWAKEIKPIIPTE